MELVPFCPGCSRFASEMKELDEFITGDPGGDEAVPATPEEREEYIRTEDGTYNLENGHFLCDPCYMRLGMPSSEEGWVCP